MLGVVVGALAAVGLTTYIQTLLFDVGRLDVAAFAAMSAVMLAVAMLASYIPARRASRVDPVIALTDGISPRKRLRLFSAARGTYPWQIAYDITMKKLAALALVLLALAPAVAAQTAASFTGKWEGTFTRVAPGRNREYAAGRVQPDTEGQRAHRHRGPG